MWMANRTLWIILVLLLALVVPVSATQVIFTPYTNDTPYRYSANSLWADMRGGAGTDIYYLPESIAVSIAAGTSTDRFDFLFRGIVIYDTSSIPDDATIVDAYWIGYVSNIYVGLDEHFNTTITGCNPATPGTIVYTDYTTFNDTIIADFIEVDDMVQDTNSTFTLNAAGRAIINKTGYTNIMTRSGNDVLNYAPAWSSEGWQTLDFESGSAPEYPAPTLVVNYTTGSTPPVAAFTSDVTVGYAPLEVTFTDTSTNTPTSWNWAYKNETVGWTQFSTSQNPEFTFPEGLYDINLTATNAGGSDDEIKTYYIGANRAAIRTTTSGDDHIGRYEEGATWIGIRSGEGNALGSEGDATHADITLTTFITSNQFLWLGRAAYIFPSAILPDDCVIGNATVNLDYFYGENALGDAGFLFTGFAPTTPGVIVYADYHTFGDIIYSNNLSYSTFSGGVFSQFVLNNDGENAINKTGNTNLMLRTHWDAYNVSPVWSNDNQTTADFYTAESGENKTPFLIINFTAPIPPTISTYPLSYINETRISPTSDTNLPPEGYNLSINATRGQYEASSFVLKPSGAVTDLQVLATDLSDGLGHTILNDNIDIKTVKAWYQAAYDIQWYDTNPEFHLTPELLLKNDSIIRVDYIAQTNEVWITNTTFSGYFHIDNQTIGQFPQGAKIYDNATVTGDIQPFTLPANENKQIWITTYIPSDTVTGNYTGKLWVNSTETTPVALNVSARVLPFNFTPAIKEHLIYYRGELPTSTPWSYTNDSVKKNDIQFAADLQDMYEHGVSYPLLSNYYNPLDPPYYQRLPDAIELLNQSDFPQDKLYILNALWSWWMTVGGDAEDYAVGTAGLNALAEDYGFTNVWAFGGDEPYSPETALEMEAYFVNTTAAGIKNANTGGGDYGETMLVLADVVDMINIPYEWNASLANQYRALNPDIKVVGYANPQAGYENPEIYRTNYGFDLWRNGSYFGTIEFAFQYEYGQSIWNDYDSGPSWTYRDDTYTYPKSDGAIDTIQWEGRREGVDDSRYADTLTAFEGNNVTTLSLINDGITASKDMSVIRNELIDAILASDMVADNPPVASFTKNVSSGYVPLAVAFTDTSTNTPTSWYWEFGDGNTSTEQNPVHLYESGGIKYIKFRAANDAGSDWLNGTPIYVTTDPASLAPVAHFYMNISEEGPAGVPPVADFVADTTTAYIGELIYFTDLSTNNPTQWEWLMGTGPTSWYHLYDKNVSYSWYTVGYYNIALTSHNAYGQDTERKDNYIHIIEPPVGYNNSISGQPLFPNDYVWNVPVNNLPLKSNSNAIIAEWVSGTMLDMQFTQPINVVDDSTPHINIFVKADGSRQYSDMYNTTHSVPVPLPMYPKVEACASWPPGSNYCDAHVLIVDTDDHMMYELGYFDNYTYSYPAADRVGAYDLTGYDLKGSYLEPYWGGTASGLETTTGILRYDEIESGEIRHALEFASLYWEESSPYYQWPARAPMGTSTSPNAPMGGERLRLKASFNTNGFSNTNKIILKGLQEFGMIYRDNLASDFDYPFITFITDDDPRWDASDIYELRAGVKNTDFEVVDVSSLMRDPDSGQVA